MDSFLVYAIFSELRKATIPIFYDMMVCEARSRGNFKLVRITVLNLDVLYDEKINTHQP